MKTVPCPDVLSRFSLEYFKAASTFGALSDDTLVWLLNHGKVLELTKDEILFKPGDRGDVFYVILQGTFAYYKNHLGKVAFIRNYKQGEQIGFMSMIALHNRVGSSVANDECLVLEVNNSLFHRLHETAPVDFGLLMMNLAREMARTLRSVDNILVDKTHEEPALSHSN
ncbi:MAG: cyclic nucleotide-binding domain-containing protein [Motiliproteus sp.]